MLYKTIAGKLVKLIRKRPSGVNTFIEVNHDGSETVLPREYGVRPRTQVYLIREPYNNKITPLNGQLKLELWNMRY